MTLSTQTNKQTKHKQTNKQTCISHLTVFLARNSVHQTCEEPRNTLTLGRIFQLTAFSSAMHCHHLHCTVCVRPELPGLQDPQSCLSEASTNEGSGVSLLYRHQFLMFSIQRNSAEVQVASHCSAMLGSPFGGAQ